MKIDANKARLNKAKKNLQKVKATEGSEIEVQPKMYSCKTCSSELNNEGMCENCYGGKVKNKIAKDYLDIVGKKNKEKKKQMKKTFREFLNYDKKKGLSIQTGLSLQSAKALRSRLITSGNRSSTEIVIRKESQ